MLLQPAGTSPLWNAIKELNCGLSYSDDDHVSILLYANDIVLLSDNEHKMQTMLDYLNKWCRTWGLTINFDKSKTVHFRAVSRVRTEFNFLCGNSSLKLVDHYKYLGIVFRKWCRLVNLDESFITKKVFMAHLDQGNLRHKTYCYRVKIFYQ